MQSLGSNPGIGSQPAIHPFFPRWAINVYLGTPEEANLCCPDVIVALRPWVLGSLPPKTPRANGTELSETTKRSWNAYAQLYLSHTIMPMCV